ncbi:MAG TPA: hypothetical protein VFW33_21305 [Gemmataceae bacterium]|nr:hypothetical protein [Gemmataceae bacterium]
MVAPRPAPNARAVARRRLDKLVAHPELLTLFGEPAPADVKRLARTLAESHELGVLPEVTPDDQVISGYPAVLAAGRAGLEEIDVIVRDDLAGRDEALVALAVIDAALARGGLTKLDLARCLKRAHALRKATPYEFIKDYQRGDLHEQVAHHLNSSLRTAERYVRLSDAPAEVQQAFARRKLALTQAERVAGLSPGKQAEFAAALRGGEKPGEVFARYFGASEGGQCSAAVAWRAFLRSLRRGLKDLGGRIDEVRSLSPEDAALLDHVVEQVQAVRKAAQVVTPGQQAANLQALCQQVRLGRPQG